MIDHMVGRLAEHVKTDGSSLADWLKLVRSYAVLGRREDAVNTVKAARERFTGNSQALNAIDTLARTLGLTS
jgi:cytochrome c-type biogenesis protein CcmH